MTDSLLSLENVAVGYGGKSLYGDVSLTVRKGEFVTLLGANGAGKSTLLRCVGGRLDPVRGVVRIMGKPLSTVPGKELAKLVSVVSTERTQAGALTVEELVALGRQPHTGFFGRLSANDRGIVSRAILAVGMGGFQDRQIASLSDGERQKVMIARALAQETPLMLLDEPTAFLDVASRLEIMQLLAGLAREEGKAIILSSHDVSSAVRLSGRLWLITEGAECDGCNATRSLIDGKPEELIENGALGRMFPGRRVEFDRSAMDFIPARCTI